MFVSAEQTLRICPHVKLETTTVSQKVSKIKMHFSILRNLRNFATFRCKNYHEGKRTMRGTRLQSPHAHVKFFFVKENPSKDKVREYFDYNIVTNVQIHVAICFFFYLSMSWSDL